MTRLERFVLWLEPLRIFKHAREARVVERAAEREHTLELIEAVLARAEQREAHTAGALAELGRGIQAQGMALSKWFDMFQHQPVDESLTTSTVTPADEHDDWQRKEIERLERAGFPVRGTPQEQLAFLQSMDDLPFS
jgi:hypothetical protein